MILSGGTRLGPHEILGPLGAGGMGEVYKARDTRLDRIVAIKILSGALAANPLARQRFDREARAISSLNHPNICTLYDIGHEGETDYLVMEYLEGETLAARLAKGPLSTDQVLKYGIEICDGLEKAHRTGVLHRDLKPGNIMLTATGAKLLDFGLAKPEPAAPAADSSQSMTSAVPPAPMSAEGTIVGTFQYMAPEQIQGYPADAKSDIFALGAVLFEMATGHPAFAGANAATTMAAVLERDVPPISTIRATAPPALDRVVRGCLAKNPDERWQTVHDVKLLLRWIADGGSTATSTSASALPIAPRARSSARIAWAVTALSLLAAIASGVILLLRAPAPGVRVQASILPPENFGFASSGFALSPDGRRLAFTAESAPLKGGALWVREMSSTLPHALADTEGSSSPFWSPDGKWIGFFASAKLKKVEAGGGPVVTIADVEAGRGATWNEDGSIVFSEAGGTRGLYLVSAGGGPVSQLTHVGTGRNEYLHLSPFFLPDGHHFLFYVRTTNQTVLGLGADRAANDAPDDASGVYLFDLNDKTQRLLLHADSAAQYADGFVLYLQQGNLMAQPFGGRSLRLEGRSAKVADQVQYSVNPLIGAFSVSANGLLAYDGGHPAYSQLTWYDREGREARGQSRAVLGGLAVAGPDARGHVGWRVFDETGHLDL
jgi:hypothetical protein